MASLLTILILLPLSLLSLLLFFLSQLLLPQGGPHLALGALPLDGVAGSLLLVIKEGGLHCRSCRVSLLWPCTCRQSPSSSHCLAGEL